MYGGKLVKMFNRKEYPNILVISNNPFSKTSNNGKTLTSFFKEFPSRNIAQLYFNHENPSENSCDNYYRISDTQILTSLYSSKDAGSIVTPTNKNDRSSYVFIDKEYKKIILRSNFSRIMREVIWKSECWKTDQLSNWIKTFSPDIVFFCAGDSGFAYDITSYVLEISGAKLITYITDDYILPRRTLSLSWWIRRNVIHKKMNNNILRSSLFITISEEMRRAYKELFGKDSIVALNMTDSMKDMSLNTENIKNNTINLIYSGGLHFKRYETLGLLAKAINDYNRQSTDKKAFLSIYSIEKPTESVLKKLNISGACKYLGGLNLDELKVKLNEADIPVHVESFDSKSIESTRLSVSTKIPEYLSLGKPVLAIGPAEVASMKCLEDVAYCICNKNEISNGTNKLFQNEQLKRELGEKAIETYLQKYNKDALNILTQTIVSLVDRI